jgi:hypothetical protein
LNSDAWQLAHADDPTNVAFRDFPGEQALAAKSPKVTRAASRDLPNARCMAEYDIAVTNKTRAAALPRRAFRLPLERYGILNVTPRLSVAAPAPASA